MRDIAIKNICRILEEEQNIVLKDKFALDFFAREGDWQTAFYAKKVKKVVAWEINPKFEEKLYKNLPLTAEITIGDSFKLALSETRKFDMIVIDNPQGCFGEENFYCEHFEALSFIPKLLKKDGILVFNVKLKPWNYNDNFIWQKRRNEFYKLNDCSNLTQDFVLEFYKDLFLFYNLSSEFEFLEKRPQESGLFSYVIKFSKE